MAASSDPPQVPLPDILTSYHGADAGSRRLFLLDYDGTLSQHVDDPATAIPTPRLYRILETLASNPRNAVWIISGRPGDFLELHLGKIAGLGISAEHGGFVRRPGSDQWEGQGMYEGELKPVWERVREVLESYVPLLPGSFIEYKRSSFTFAYRMAPAEDGARLTKEMQDKLREMLSDTPGMVVKQGIFVIEVRPAGIHKGEIVKGLVDEYAAAEGGIGFALCAGDEGTDEDMFAALTQSVQEGRIKEGKAWNVWVKGVHDLRTIAQWGVAGVSRMIDLLGELAGVGEE